MDSPLVPPSPWADRWRHLSQRAVQAFHRYANWLVGISWKRFLLLSVLLIAAAAILQELPPFSWRVTETVREPAVQREHAKAGGDAKRGMEIAIDEKGVRISPLTKKADAAPSASSAAAPDSVASASAPASSPAPAAPPTTSAPSIEIKLPPGLSPEVREAVREAVSEARTAIQEAIEEHRDATREAQQAPSDAAIDLPTRMVERTRRVHWGDFLTDLALLWVVGSSIIKATYKGRMQAEAKAAVATETAESESLKRQVMEARMAAMQAQVEPHFLFNTLASIDHLIETDAARASQMQKNLIALLRASMPSLREANASGVRDLGRELAVVRPYLEILKVRMEERLSTSIDVPDGLLSAEFPPLMLQSLVENAIKHGLEPKPEGGSLTLRAEIVHGKLAVSVADSGLGFGMAQTAGTGVGLANIRERLELLYGSRGRLEVAENPGGGTRVTITVPYRSIESAVA
jgi:signal transduction histidine kinase